MWYDKVNESIIKHTKSAAKATLWLLWEFSGLRAIWEKIHPPRKELADRNHYRKPPTFFLWVVSIYVALFGVASQRYQSRIDSIRNSANVIFTQLGSSEPEARKNAFRRIGGIQKMERPVKPDILEPSSVVLSFFKTEEHSETVETLKRTIEDWRSKLDGVDLRLANLQKADLGEANLQEADLWKANLQKAEGLTIQQLCSAKSLCQTKMDRELAEKVFLKCFHLLK